MRQNDVTIVSMTREHLPAVAQLEQVCFSDPWPISALESELENELSLWLVALEGTAVVGYVGSQSVLGEADMMNVAVAPACRRRGIGEALLRRLEEELSRNAVTSITLEVRVSNAPAVAAYEKLGYRQVGLRPNYYFHPKEDALILRKEWTI